MKCIFKEPFPDQRGCSQRIVNYEETGRERGRKRERERVKMKERYGGRGREKER